MANYRAEVKPISRAKGHNAVAAAAYRAGEELTDTNKYNPDAKTYDYSKKSDVMHKNIILPKSLSDQDFSIDRQTLWSAVEQHEVTQRGNKMKANARVGREWLLSLPHELSDEENIALAEEFAQKMADDLGVIADCCIHNPKLSNKQKDDDRNIHAHIMFTTRKTSMTADGELVLGDKADSELDGTARKAKGLAKETDYIKEIRQTWADMVNERLAKHDIALVSSLSYKDRNLDIVPTVKVRRGSPVLTMKEEYNHDITKRNELVFSSRVDIVERFASAANASADGSNRNTEHSKQRLEFSERQLESSKHCIENSKQRLEFSERQLESRASSSAPAPTPFTARARARERAASELSDAAEHDDYHAKRHSRQLEVVIEQVDVIIYELVAKIIYRDRHKLYICPYGIRAAQPDAAERYDKRQLELIGQFADRYGLNPDKQGKRLPYDFIMDAKTALTDKIIDDNTDILALVRHPQREREHYAQAQIERSSQQTDQITPNVTITPKPEPDRDWQPPTP